MNRTGTNLFVRLACLILAAAFLFAPSGAAADTGKHAGPPFYNVIVSAENEHICVGESTDVTVKYWATMGPVRAAPKISVQFDPADRGSNLEKTGGYARGKFTFTYTGTIPGNVKIWAIINEEPNTQAGGDFVLIHVGKCEYSYELEVLLHWSIEKQLTFSTIHSSVVQTLRSKGNFSLSFSGSPPAESQVLTGDVQVLTFTMSNVPRECEPKPTDWKYKGENGNVGFTAKGDRIGPDVLHFWVVFSNPDVVGAASWTAHCLGKTNTHETPLIPFFLGQKRWIVEEFSEGGGTRSIRIESMRDIVLELREHGIKVTDYSATLKITPLDPPRPGK